MNDQNKPSLTWRSQITIAPDQDSRLRVITRETVRRALVDVGAFADAVDILVPGRVDVVTIDAGMDLALHLSKTTDIRVIATGSGGPDFLEAIRYGLQAEARFREDDRLRAEARIAREAGL